MASPRCCLALLAAAALVGCQSEPAPQPTSEAPSIPFRTDGQLAFLRDGASGTDTLHTIAIEVADTDSTRARGLMERPTIPPDTGMLFLFPSARPQSFYMMNTPHSLDIQFYGADSTLINVAESTTPYSIETVSSEGPAQFVVEVAAGVSRRLGLVPGDRITWSRAASRTVPGDSP